MNPDLDVDTEQLHGVASAVEATAARVREAASSAPSPVRGPRWATTDAAASAAETSGRHLRELGTDLRETAQHLEAILSDYAEADARAATRLRAAR
jgi:hypothetical protein